MKVSFRKAKNSDKSFLLTLRKLSMTEHLAAANIVLTDKQHLARIEEFYSDSTIILMNAEVIGLVKLGLLAEKVHIRQLQILPDFQGKGIGGRVLEVIKKKAMQLKLPVTLNVLLNNPAKNLYLKHGFIVEGNNGIEFQMRFSI